MNAFDTELSQKLTQAISCAVPNIFGDGCELASHPPQRLDRRYSFMFRYWLKKPDGEMVPLLVKIPHESWMKTMQEAIQSAHIGDVIRSEFESMAAIATVISEAGHPGLTAIGRMAVLPDFNALLMEEIPIRMLKTSLTRPAIMLGSKKEWQAFEAQLKLSGEWLKVIHARFMSGQTASLKSLKMNEKVETELKILEGFMNKPLNNLRHLFLLLYESLNAVEIPLTCLHNDFHLGNLFVTGDGQVGALDPNWVERGPIYDDLSTLMIYPLACKAQVLSQGLSFRSSLRKRYEHALLNGYIGGSPDPDPMLDLYCALAMLIKWRADEEFLNSGASKWIRTASFIITPLVRGYFQRVIWGYLKRGLKAVQTTTENKQKE